MPLTQNCETQKRESHWIAGITRVVTLGIVLAAACAAQKNPAPRPQTFDTAPVPSSFFLVLAGMAGLLAWNWWRNRARPEQK
jgi:hypothetical protein